MKTKTILLLTTAITAFSSFPDARANTINSGSISGIFSSPVLSGAVIDFDGKTLIPVDNSALTFTGKSFSDVAPGQVFDLGTITYRNANSFRETLIFGATLTLTVNSTQAGSIDASVSSVDFLSTANHLLPDGQLDPTFKL